MTPPIQPEGGEVTVLTPPEEAAFRRWALFNRINDVDRYDYRGYWKSTHKPPVDTVQVKKRMANAAVSGERSRMRIYTDNDPGNFSTLSGPKPAQAADKIYRANKDTLDRAREGPQAVDTQGSMHRLLLMLLAGKGGMP